MTVIYALWGESSDYATSLAEGLGLLGVETIRVEDIDALERVFAGDVGAVVLLDPSEARVRDARAFLDSRGDGRSRISLLAAFTGLDRLADQGGLRLVDDFIVSPGGAGELVYRVKATVDRRGGEGETESFGELIINLDAHQVFLDGRPLVLTLKEFELLHTMALSPGKAFSREELLRRIWGYEYFGGTRTVDVHIRRLRSKIEDKQSYIQTVHGVGYRFVSP